jgi:hypothetical protein
MRFDMTAIDRLTSSARQYKFAVALAAAGLLSSVTGMAQQKQPEKPETKKQTTEKTWTPGGVHVRGNGTTKTVQTKNGKTVQPHTHPNVKKLVNLDDDTVYVENKNKRSILIDSAAKIYYHYDLLNNAAVFSHYDSAAGINHTTRAVGMSSYFEHKLDTANVPQTRWALMELSEALAIGAETRDLKKKYNKGAHYMNPRHTYYMATGENRADVRQQAGRYWEWGAVGPNLITESLGVPDRINQHLTMRAAYRLYTQDPNAIGGEWSFNGPWRNTNTEVKRIPNHAILGFGVETGANSPLILGAEAGFDVYWGNTINFLNRASTYTNLYAGVRFFPKSIISVEATAQYMNTYFNNNMGPLMGYDADRGSAMGYQIRATARLGNIIKDKGFKKNDRDGVYFGVTNNFSGNPAINGTMPYIGLIMANPLTGLVLNERDNRFTTMRIALGGDHVLGSMGLETPATSRFILGAEAGAKAYVSTENGYQATSQFAKGRAGLRLNPTGVFAVELTGFYGLEQFQTNKNQMIQYPEKPLVSGGIEVGFVFRPQLIR